MGEPADRQAALERELEQEFLAFLNSDRSEQGLSPAEVVNHRARRYVEVHARLVRLFAWRGCHEPEFLADRALDRAKQTLKKRDSSETEPRDIPNPVGYVCSFVRFIFLEWLTEQRTPDLPIPSGKSDVDEVALDCLDQCLEGALAPEERKVICEYYQGQKRAKIDNRKEVAGRHNLSVNALRIECHRIRRRLRTCVFACMRLKRPEMIPGNSAFPSEDRTRA
jgi:DNA-directed RNA polymerase specialized sigma24 family protein